MKATFVATFSDGETVRMRTYCPHGLDWERGKRLAGHAWQTRSWQKRVNPEVKHLKLSYPDCPDWERDQENKATRRELLERFCEGLAEVPTPEISDYHFEVDGAVFHESEQEAG